MRRGQPSPLVRGLVLVCAMVLLGANIFGCVCTADWCATFRDAANPLFQSGAVDIVSGIINGIFALLQPDDSSASASASQNFSMSSDPNN